MNAGIRHIGGPPPASSSMKGPFLTSALFHIVLIIISIVGLPFIAKERVIIATPISVQLVDIDELTQTNRVAPPKNKPKEIEAPKPPAAKPTPPKMTEEAPPDLTKPKPPKPVKDKPKDTEKPVLPPDSVKKKDPVKPKPKPKPRDKPKPKATQNDFQSLLKNLAPDAGEEQQEKTKNKQTESPVGQIAKLSDQLTISELDALKYQIARCWNVPTGIKYAEDLAVEIRVVINPDGTINRTSVVDKGRYNRDSAFRAAADSAVRALRNPRCSPLKLPPGKYNEWKNTVMNFDPKDML